MRQENGSSILGTSVLRTRKECSCTGDGHYTYGSQNDKTEILVNSVTGTIFRAVQFSRVSKTRDLGHPEDTFQLDSFALQRRRSLAACRHDLIPTHPGDVDNHGNVDANLELSSRSRSRQSEGYRPALDPLRLSWEAVTPACVSSYLPQRRTFCLFGI